MNIDELINKYLQEIESIRRYSPNTVKSYKTDLIEFAKFCEQNNRMELNKITERFLKSYLMLLSDKDLDKRSISRKLAAIRSTLKFAFQNDLIDENPVSFIKNPKNSRKLPEIVATDLILKIYDLADESDEKPELVKVIFELLYGCALRSSELCDLKYDDYSENKFQLRVLGKGSKMRIVPIGEKSIIILRDYLKKNPVSFKGEYLIRTKKNDKLYPRLVHRIVNKY